jgi:putative ABC transport system ATP-binding protein
LRATLRRETTKILHDVDVTFEPKRRYVIVGPSGSGKSTLLRMLNRLEDPTSGEVLIGPTPLRNLPVGLVRRSVGLVFQAPRPLPGTVRENLEYPWSLRGRERPHDSVLHACLDRVGLEGDILDRDAQGLSGGERQRLALAMVLQNQPEILALDEPTASLDPETARTVAALLERLSRESGLRTITVCHQPDIAPWLGETVVVIEAGRVVDVGPIGPVLAQRRSVFLQAEAHRSRAAEPRS